MTVGVDDEMRIREYPGDDSANARAVPFKFFDNDDLKITRTNADGSETVLVRGTHYSVAGAGNPAGGSVTPLAPIAAGTIWRIEGDMSLGQPTDYTAGDDFPAESHERGLDRAMIGLQEARRDANDRQARSWLVPRGEQGGVLPTAAGRANRFRAWDAVGDEVAASGTGNDAAFRDDWADPDIGGRLGAFQAGVGARVRTIDAELRDRAVSIMSYYQPVPDAGDFAPAVGRAIDDGVDHLFFPVRDGGYDFSSSVSRTLTRDFVLDANGQVLRFSEGAYVELKGSVIATGRTLANDAVRYDKQVVLNSGAGIARGDLLHVNTAIAPLSAWTDKKQDCARVAGVAGATVTLDAGINFPYDTADAGLSITIYRPVRVTIIRPVIHILQTDGDTVPVVGFQLEGLDGVSILAPKFRGDLPFDRSDNIYRRGIYIYRCWNWSVDAPDAEAMSYTIGVYGGSRNGFERNVTARYCHHAHADVGNFSSDYLLSGMNSNDCYQALNTHPAFRCFAENANVFNDYGLCNWRVFGGGFSNIFIQSSVDDTAEMPQYQNLVTASGHEYLNGDADFSAVNVRFDTPNRPSKTPFGVRFGRTVYWSRIVSANNALASYNLGEVETLVIGPGNEFGATKASIPPIGGFVNPTTIRLDAPPGRQHSIAAAATLTLPIGIDVVTITGSAPDITAITADGHVGRRVTMVFTGFATVVDGGNLRLSGNFASDPGHSLTLVCHDGVNWTEASRSAN